ncbi:MAG TPA: hypothetical protein PLF63_05040 [Rubrivivax sp.]|jgi:hypothetical protein|nr:hypothetical protein [Rubrivivax sp.]
MQVSARQIQLPSRLRSLAGCVVLLERLDRQPRTASASQYRQVVEKVSSMLSAHAADPALAVLLSASPAASELYENQHYDSAGLCRSDLDLAVQAEVMAQQVLSRVRCG